mmetsp:Transcript_4132/g.6898  ORF Transcript_4132/g.6898 Transcript_4132/m.6898 type:complete len:81 (+) Transcript_4132:2833-3075(+)
MRVFAWRSNVVNGACAIKGSTGVQRLSKSNTIWPIALYFMICAVHSHETTIDCALGSINVLTEAAFQVPGRLCYDVYIVL